MDSSETPARPRIRLQRFLASCGLGSRRACEEFITEGRITVDGQTVSELGATVDPSSQTIALDGERLRMERKKYYVLHKPPGYLCTNSDPSGRRKAIDLLPAEGPRLFTVGRLDENSTGLLVVTNDGDLAEKLAHPRNQIFRTYQIQVAGHPTSAVYESLKEGLRFAEGRFRVRAIKSLKKVGQSTWLEVVLSEGHNREVRRLFARVGHKVLKLSRVSFGPIRLGKLKMGEFRDLSVQEVEALHGILANVRERGPGPDSGQGRDRREGSGPKPAFESKGPARKRSAFSKDRQRSPFPGKTRTESGEQARPSFGERGRPSGVGKGRRTAADKARREISDRGRPSSEGKGRDAAGEKKFAPTARPKSGKRPSFRPKAAGGGRPRSKKPRR
ncbi:Ribosomal large subunit pseudouridine synthase B [Caulifigura coniformis]|uniref:Pseudouridine synthase n=1 Tax=Caulifigura coniformis TaxID=2527983 RepID=A0A517SG21_9PLAN|nr:pseudouridine synthase [Caulifigura coniformis]QDT55017.1 Ribosomal large subunit pseudouridine synthase B [Caulifigura coniformis]